jgi:diguanylate cyclase (GGDEF)-like protein/PAS domain S-box-containing protein
LSRLPRPGEQLKNTAKLPITNDKPLAFARHRNLSAMPASHTTHLVPSTSMRRMSERKQTARRSSVQTSDEIFAARLRARQYLAVMRHLPLATGTALASTLVIAAFTPGVAADTGLLTWLVSVVTLLLLHSQHWWRWRQRGQESRVSTRTLMALILHAGVFAALWGAVPGWMLAQANGGQHALLAGSLTGMLCIGGVTLAAVPAAAYAYLGGLSLSLLVSQLMQPSAQLGAGAVQWAGCAAVMVGGVLMMSRTLRARVTAELQAEHQGELIDLLLRDFEEQGNDLLWQIDERGRLLQVSQRLSDALGRSQAELQGRPLLDVLAQLQLGLSDVDRNAAQMLHSCLTEGQPFRDVLLPMRVKGHARWWSLTAKPLINEQGTAMGWRGVARDVTQALMADKHMAWLAHFDTLTGLTNRTHFRVLLETALQQARPPQRGGAVMCLDLDHFKTVNDTLGYPTGDTLLMEVARRLKAAVNSDDVVGRLGGDEFAVLVRSAADVRQINQTAQRILDAMREPCTALGAQVPVRLSIGIACFPQDGESVDELMQHAELALYDAKTSATGSMKFYATSMGEQMGRRRVHERDLREAIDKQQLALHYQPKVDLQTWDVTGFEALLRWRHPEHGNIPPGEFIPVAEDSGLILPIGEWVLVQACQQAARWPVSMQLSVNLSSMQLMAENLPDTVERALASSGLAPQRLELDITESVFINETRTTLARLHALRKLGVRIALDDFGAGYSSLSYLRRFPFDTLKIDRAFVREVLISRDVRAIVRNILALAKSLRMSTVAEGVEEPAQVTVLGNEGCDLVQGFLVSRPMPASDVVGFLLDWGKRKRPESPSDSRAANPDMARPARDAAGDGAPKPSPRR